MKILSFVFAGTFGLAFFCFSAQQETVQPGRRLEQSSCTPCHSTRLVDSQRLSASTWAKEVDKMIGWGAVVPERQALIDYLAAQYSDSKAVPAPASSANGAKPR